MSVPFSISSRSKFRESVCTDELDLLIIGGGITGAGILLDAQARGLKAGLVEMQDFAAGTSNRSTKLVHGGLRYLKQFEIGLVAEVGKERAVVYENGAHITTPVWMLLPIIEGGTFGKLASSFGIFVYDILAGVKRRERRKMLSYDETLAREPLLRRDKLKGSGYYVEYRTDDARLTLEIMKEAVDRGASALNYTKAQRLLYSNERVVGAEVLDLVTNESYEIRAKHVVNATGPWVDELREQDGSKTGKMIHLTKGVHVVVDGERFPLRNSVYFDVPDGRMVFAIPRDGKTYIGTTDTNYDADLMYPRMTVSDRNYLIECVNFMFPSVRLKADDIESSWAGVRPLIHEEGKDPSEISRRDEVFVSGTGLLTIAGGKLTGYRKMAEKVVSMVATSISSEEPGRRISPCATEHIAYSGGKFGGSENLEGFLAEKTAKGVELGLAPEKAKQMAQRYGTNVDTLFDIIQNRGEVRPINLDSDVFAEITYGIEAEMVVTPSDFFIRRTASLYFDIDWVLRWKDAVVRYMADLLDWTDEQSILYANELDRRIEEATSAMDDTISEVAQI